VRSTISPAVKGAPLWAAAPVTGRKRPDGPRAAAAGAALALVAPLAFLVGHSVDVGSGRTVELAAALAALVAAVVIARRIIAGPGLTVLGVVVVVSAAWLVPQRPDPASTVILAGLFGVGLGLAHPGGRRGAMAEGSGLVVALVALVLAVALRAAGWGTALLVLAVALVAAGGLLRPDRARKCSRAKEGGVGAPPGLGTRPRAAQFMRRPSRGGRGWGPAQVAEASGESAAGRRVRRLRVVSVGLFVVVVVGGYVGYLGGSTVDAAWFGGGVTHGDRHRGEVALTFDDGPNPTASLQVARILDEHDTKGTFFQVGKAIAARPDLVRRLHDDGQLLGNHSYTHDSWAWLDPWYREMGQTDRAFDRAIGRCPTFYRPPHGQRTPFVRHVADNHRERMVLWDVSAQDWVTKDPRLIARRILAGVRPGSIILLHDGLDGDVSVDRSVLVRALPLILDGLEAKGLKPVRLDQLIGGAASRPC